MNASLRNYLDSDSKEAISFAKTRSKNLQHEADAKALKLFKRASTSVPAYKDFLKKNKVDASKINSIEEYRKHIPATSKENYIFQYNLENRCWDGNVNFAHTFAASSGSTGEPIFWPRGIDQEVEGARIHEYLFRNVFEVHKKKTLFINSFGLGNWIAGIYTEFCLYLTKLHGLPFTLASPGYNQEETFKVVKSFAQYYEQIIIACHPPILKMMIENGVKEGIDWKKLNVKFLGAGEGFSENWRNYLLSLVDQKDPFHSMINVYGSADAGLMGFETPLSILLHRETALKHDLNKSLFKSERNPYLYQFDPTMRYLESNNKGEIIVTMNATMPLIRYDIHDQGGTFSYSDLLMSFPNISKNYDVHPEDWKFPFIYIFGRDRFMTSLYGVNIYPENIKAVLEHASMQPFLTGRFISSKETDKNQNYFLSLRVELKPEVMADTSLKKNLEKLFVQIVKKLNSEYNQVEEKFKAKMHPHIIFSQYQDPQYFPEGKIKKMA